MSGSDHTAFGAVRSILEGLLQCPRASEMRAHLKVPRAVLGCFSSLAQS
ncbi:hypothetical protein [Pseudovibrio sp. WM33]|nr:hypothetical protein [Pseudovibrio sp. WM33]